ncbi:Oidioi.mRNA.OKI2018_I69.XSR.g16974.t1.cds [Oikopleura dioica]|uniref:Oidioi.mRNA.OKI2018_I69.XSR.g16974.t1.cds n=1 Tax=Oikopleura dioica TaxID=34765 RepID=A0ABN7SM04_OIKDI|nr:Oidioi.mRNA.OKI2018_I69.XSR.g16974.t1.cds [Oikopleura dioica]
MSSGFFSEKEAEQNRISRQKEWERVRKPNDPKEAPLDQLKNARPLHQQLEENRVAEQEALNDSLALKNQIRGLNEDETAYLNSVSNAEMKIERERQREADLLIGALKRNQSSYSIRNDATKPVLVEKSKLSETGLFLLFSILDSSIGP